MVIVTLCQSILFDNRHNQRAGSIVFRLPGGRNDFVMMINECVNGPLTFFQTDGRFGSVLNDALRVLVGGIRFQPQGDIKRIFFFVFQNNKVITLNEIKTAAHQRVRRFHFIAIQLIF